MVVTTTHQTDENATAPCEAELFLYLSARYIITCILSTTPALFLIGCERLLESGRWTNEKSIERRRMFIRGRNGVGKCGGLLPTDYC